MAAERVARPQRDGGCRQGCLAGHVRGQQASENQRVGRKLIEKSEAVGHQRRSLGPDVARIQHHFEGQFALNVEIPGLCVAEPPGVRRPVKSAALAIGLRRVGRREGAHARVSAVPVERGPQVAAVRDRIRHAPTPTVTRRAAVGIAEVIVRRTIGKEYAIARPYDGLRVHLEREADARSEVMVVLLHETCGPVASGAIPREGEGARQARLRVGGSRTEAEEAVVLFGLGRVVVPAEAEVHRQPGSRVEIVLNEQAERPVCRQGRRRDGYRSVVDGAQQEAGERVAHRRSQAGQSGLVRTERECPDIGGSECS